MEMTPMEPLLPMAPPAVSPGSDCPTCQRRVPHPKKPSSPQSEVFSFRMPLDVKESFKEILTAAAAHRGLSEKPYFQYWTILQGLALLLQEPTVGAED